MSLVLDDPIAHLDDRQSLLELSNTDPLHDGQQTYASSWRVSGVRMGVRERP